MKNATVLGSFVIAAATLGLASQALAIPINTSEADFGGDFSHISSSETDVGTLDIGTNTIRGAIGVDDPGDDFRFTLGAGSVIVSTTLTVQSLSNTGQEPGGGFAVIFEQADLTNLDNVSFSSNGVFGLVLPDPQSGVYEFNTESTPTLFSATFDWEVAIDVAAVPEPSAAIVFGFGALIFGSMTRRRTIPRG